MTNRAIAYLFPGQGAHDCSMLDSVRSLPRFEEWYEVVRSFLPGNPEEELAAGNRGYVNRNGVSSLLTVLISSLMYDDLARKGQHPDHLAGYSVGQWTAIHASGGLSFERLVEMVAIRAQRMDACFETCRGAMMAVIGLGRNVVDSFVRSLREKGYFITISNENCLGQYSLAGTEEAIEHALHAIMDLQPRKAVRLPVDGAWHCEMLQGAASGFARDLETVSFDSLKIPVWDNTTAEPLPDDPVRIRERLCNHLTQPVLWQTSLQNMIAAGVGECVEVGYGNTLTKFGFFINRDITHRFLCSS